MTSRTILFSFLLLIATNLPAQTAPSAASVSDSATAIAQSRTQWAAALNAKRLDDCLALYTADATFLEPRGNRIQGRQAIHDIFQLAFAAIDSSIELTSISLQASGDLAFDSGSYKETAIVHGTTTPIPISGNYLTVYQHAPDGHWLILQQAWTADATPIQQHSARPE